MIDIHSHVLPGIDDGAPTLAEAVEMCRLAHAAGCDALVATPHQRTESWSNLDRPRLEKLQRQLQEAVGERPRILLGAEVRVDSELLADLESPASEVLPLAGSRYLLLELPRRDPLGDPLGLVHELRLASWTPVFAHPEFIAWLADDLGLVAGLAERGALFQVTAMSVSGEFGRPALERCRRLLDAGLVHFVASDAHGVRWRPPGLERAARALAQGWGEEVARRLTADNPRAVVEDRPLLPAAAVGQAVQ
jgi:protein-tyrosine phosphatase